MTTARDIVELALKEVGVLGVGQTALDEDINDGFTLFQRMIAQWQRRRWLIPNLIDVSMPGNDAISNTIGNGGYYNTPRPDKIQAAYVIQLNTGTTPVSLPLAPIFSYEDYARIAVKDINTLPDHFFYDGAYPLGNVFCWPIPSSIYEVHLILKNLIGFSTGVSDGEITNQGALYTDGNYVGISLTGGAGQGATADITVTAGKVAIVTLDNPGNDYAVGNVLSADPATIGGTGAGFLWTVTETAATLDSEFIMPEEYEEAMHYNLSIRLSSMYQMPPNNTTIALAKGALNTIRKANAQIPRMTMPPGLQKGKAFSLWNPDGY